jgi:rRNA processing protein Gar1
MIKTPTKNIYRMTESLIRLGNIVELGYNGLVLVRAETVPRANAEVVDSRMKPVGRVVRIFGPVGKPFVTVRPQGRDSELLVGLLGKEVYLKEVYKNGKIQKNR